MHWLTWNSEGLATLDSVTVTVVGILTTIVDPFWVFKSSVVGVAVMTVPTTVFAAAPALVAGWFVAVLMQRPAGDTLTRYAVYDPSGALCPVAETHRPLEMEDSPITVLSSMRVVDE